MQVTDEMVWRIVNLDPNYFSEDQARAMLEHVLGGEPEPAPEWSLDKVIPRLLSALEASQKPLSEEERMRNLRVNLAAEIYKQVITEEHLENHTKWLDVKPSPGWRPIAIYAFNAADVFIVELKRMEGK